MVVFRSNSVERQVGSEEFYFGIILLKNKSADKGFSIKNSVEEYKHNGLKCVK